MTSSTDSASSEALALARVQQGWRHLQLQRPLAAWASWQQALRIETDFLAAKQALETLESAAELPAAARAVYRFRTPRGADRRARWDLRIRGRDHEPLDEAADAFAALSVEDPTDSAAAFNEGLCLAWLGRNVEAIGALDCAVRLLAGDDFDRAVEAWTLAEVLRQGGGAETLADDLRHAWIVEEPDPDVVPRLANRVTLVTVPPPLDPVTEQSLAVAEIFEWLDRPLSADPAALKSAVDVPRLLATVVRTPRALRLSSPDPRSLDEIHDLLIASLGDVEHAIRREATPLPLPLLDASLWMFRLPRGLDPEAEHQLTRGAVESFYEDRWIHVPRKGLDGLSPLDAARLAAGDLVMRAKLTAVIRLREQLGDRPRTAALYQGYPFDRLRRRLGLEVIDPSTVDPEDPTCMSGAGLDQRDPSALDDVRLSDALESASGLRDDGLMARFAAELARRQAPSLNRLDLSPDVRAALKWTGDGLIPAVVQEAETGDVLMLAWMDEEALRQTLLTGQTHFYSRSRKSAWHKGGTSGHIQNVEAILVDCDADVLLIKARQVGGACHEGYRSCFFRRIDAQGRLEIIAEPVFDAENVYGPRSGANPGTRDRSTRGEDER